MAQAHKDAATLRQDKSRGSSVYHILASRSWVQLKETFKIYKNTYSEDFVADVQEKIFYVQSSWYKEAISAIYQYAMDSNTFFAISLFRDLIRPHKIPCQGWGRAYGVARVFTWRAENDLGDIAKAYVTLRVTFPDAPKKETLVKSVERFTEGWPETTLIGILQ